MDIHEFEFLTTKEKIDVAIFGEPIAGRESSKYFYVVYQMSSFFAELKFNKLSESRLAINAKAISTSKFLKAIRNGNGYFICEDFS